MYNKCTHYSCIPQTTEKFLSLQAYINGAAQIRFLDSLQFLSASLSKLVAAASDSPPLTMHLQDIPHYAKKAKGIFPYSFANSIERLNNSHTVFIVSEINI